MTEDKKRLNIAIDAELHRQLKIAAAQQGITIVQMVSEGIKDKIKKSHEQNK